MLTHRDHRIHRAAALALTASALTLTGCVSWGEARFHGTRSVSAPYLGTMGLDVQTVNGSIEVFKASANTIEITAEIRARTQERLDNTFIVANQIDNNLVVRVEWPDGKRLSNEGCALTIAMPETESITLKSSNGRLTVTSLSGVADLVTSNGRITVTDHLGDVRADTSNGRITLDSIDGAVLADTSNGRVRITGVTGPVEVDTSNGSVVVELTDDNPGPVNIDTANGGVTLAVGDAFAGAVTADTNNGSIHCGVSGITSEKISRSHWRFVFAGEGGRSKLDTNNGSITIKRLGDASATAD
jgi:DUF4097 and DUF4098 domain-containing protein YvlB